MENTPVEVKEVEIKVSQEQVLQVLAGTRPIDMEYNVFKQVRKDINKQLKSYKKGRMMHLSSYFTTETNEDKLEMTIKHTKTYKKPANLTQVLE